MKELIDEIVSQLKVSERQATGGAAIVLKAARDKIGPAEFSRLMGPLEGIDSLISQAPAAGGMGRLFGGFAAALGAGNAGIIAGVVTGFSQLGLSTDHAHKFLPVILNHFRAKIGDATVAKIEKTLRA